MRIFVTLRIFLAVSFPSVSGKYCAIIGNFNSTITQNKSTFTRMCNYLRTSEEVEAIVVQQGILNVRDDSDRKFLLQRNCIRNEISSEKRNDYVEVKISVRCGTKVRYSCLLLLI